MKVMNKIWTLGLLAMSVAFTSCDDYFETDPKNIVNEGDYIAEEDEMYKGFLGIFSRMQEAGDHAIFLTDTRGALLETTDNAPTDLKAIYNYDNTYGNPYAAPTCYYAIIVACNDYFMKMGEFHSKVGGMTEIAEENFAPLISSAIRIKAWAYLMLGKIYGKAYWFDDPLTEKKELTDTSVFTLCNMKELADRAIALLENGMTIDGVPVAGDLDVAWYKWLDPENQDRTLYYKWEYLTPPAVVLNAEFRSWRASYVDESAAQADWEWIRNNLLDYFYSYQRPLLEGEEGKEAFRVEGKNVGQGLIFQLSKMMQSDNDGAYSNIFFTETTGSQYQLISTIMYDYTRYQRNRIVQYFCPEYPDAESFYLKPSEYGMNLYNESDIRSATQGWVMNTLGGKTCVSKYYYGYDFALRRYKYLDDKQLFEIQPSIPTFRGHDLHFLLAEAELHLGHYDQAYVILNNGLSDEFPDKVLPLGEGSNWDERYLPWVNNANGGYGNIGIAGTAVGRMHDLPRPGDADWSDYTEDEIKKMYDWALADEHMKEYIAEGKSYSYMCKIAERYANQAYRGGDPAEARDSVAARIAPKYAPAGRESTVANRIKSDGYFVEWELDNM